MLLSQTREVNSLISKLDLYLGRLQTDEKNLQDIEQKHKGDDAKIVSMGSVIDAIRKQLADFVPDITFDNLLIQIN